MYPQKEAQRSKYVNRGKPNSQKEPLDAPPTLVSVLRRAHNDRSFLAPDFSVIRRARVVFGSGRIWFGMKLIPAPVTVR